MLNSCKSIFGTATMIQDIDREEDSKKREVNVESIAKTKKISPDYLAITRAYRLPGSLLLEAVDELRKNLTEPTPIIHPQPNECLFSTINYKINNSEYIFLV